MRVRSKYSGGSEVVSKQAAEAFSTSDGSATSRGLRGGEEEDVSFALMFLPEWKCAVYSVNARCSERSPPGGREQMAATVLGDHSMLDLAYN